MPEIAHHFEVIDPAPKENQDFFGAAFDMVIAIQSLYYLSDTHLEILLRSLRNNMKRGGIIYATMIGTGHYLYNYSVEHKDGLSKIEFKSPRLGEVKNYFANFTYSEEDLLKKFSMFEKRHIGYYDDKFREDEGGRFHYTFVGQKV